MNRGILVAAMLSFAAATAARPVKIEHDSGALEFSYKWPAEAAAIALLDRKFRADMEKAYREALANGREDLKLYRSQKREGARDFYSMTWRAAGETSRLLSLQNELSTFTGGAHPNTSYDALIWDRKLNHQTSMGALLSGSGKLEATTRPAYCKALEEERSKRREGEKLGLAEFNACPKYSDLAIAPVDSDRNGRFDTIDFVASPYLAGPYAEGKYEIKVPVTSKLIEALKAEFRGSFEVQRQ
jgi:peptidoglycan-N-acetylmuramic acid deacetylase PdaC-like protein